MPIVATKKQKRQIADIPGPGAVRSSLGKISARLKRAIRENVRDRDVGFSDSAARATGIFGGKRKSASEIAKRVRKLESGRRKEMRSNIKELIKIRGKKATAKFTKEASK